MVLALQITENRQGMVSGASTYSSKRQSVNAAAPRLETNLAFRLLKGFENCVYSLADSLYFVDMQLSITSDLSTASDIASY